VEHIKIDIDYINNLAQTMSKNTIVPLEELPKYDLFLSQVIDFLNDKFEGEGFTNNIVQNYIKNEVIAKPEDGKKRGYTKIHLTQLVLLSYMRPILTTEEIKKVFSLAFNDINDRNDDIISWESAYKIFTDIQNKSFEEFVSMQHLNENKLRKIIKDNNLEVQDQEKVMVFLISMTLICQASAVKNLAKKIIDEYTQDV
jgi:uncharacterized protein YeeX (DUF496 family)